MGYMMSSPIVRFVMTLFNVRLGWWLGNPGAKGDSLQRTFDLDSPKYSITPIVQEALGMTNDKHPYVYLSDGGHFENLGLYEMVLRCCRFIVVSDASTDTKYSFDSLAMAIRQIRVDFGIPIEFEKFYITSPSQERDKGGTYCAIGKIRYSCLNLDNKGGKKEFDGTIIYLKPSLLGDEPRDVLNYSRESSDFPQETIADQYFSEAQFESYRALGSHIVDQISLRRGMSMGDSNEFPNLDAFADNLKQRLGDFSQRM